MIRWYKLLNPSGLRTVHGWRHSRLLQTTSSSTSEVTSPSLESYVKPPSEPTSPKLLLNFSSHSFAFKHKKTSELIRGLVVLHACAIDTLVIHSHRLLELGRRILGERLLRKVLSPFYNQFVAGDTEEELATISRNLHNANVKLMVLPVMESDVGEGHEIEAMYQKNLDKTLYLIGAVSRHGSYNGIRPICQTKHTAHLSADVLARITTAYESLDEKRKAEAIAIVADCLEILGTSGSRQAEKFPSLDILGLVPDDRQELLNYLSRLYKIGEKSVRENTILAVDAEYTYTNPAINLLTLAMMKVFNKDQRPTVWNTYQGYLKAGRRNLEHDLRLVRSLGNFSCGVKVVRGAYLERERALAQQEGYPDPVNDTYEDTCATYNSMVDLMLHEVKENPEKRSVIIATHNEESVHIAASKIQELDLDTEAGNVVFGQVYGMAENITLPLAQCGYLVYKSVAYGSMAEALPYLSRRAIENRAVLRGSRKERDLLSKELRSRLSFSKS